MAILSASEFEAIIGQIISRIDKEIGQLGKHDILEGARDELGRIRGQARDSAKLKAARPRLDKLSETVPAILKDDHVLNQMWDLLDFIDYRA